MPWEQKFAYLLNAFVGAILGVLIHLFALSGLTAHLTRETQWWNGSAAFVLLATVGALIGAISHHHRHHEYNLPLPGLYDSPDRAALLTSRLITILGAVIALYFLWQLAKSI